MVTVRKSISISTEQAQFLKKQNISLSKLAQKAIDNAIDDLNFAKAAEQGWQEIQQGKSTRLKKSEFLRAIEKW